MLGTSRDINNPGLRILPPGVERYFVKGGGLSVIEVFPEDKIEIINEELILFAEGLSKRPDKIIVKADEIIILDFKTGKENKEHQLQLETYQSIVESMYDRKARIFIYYSEIDELKEV